MKTGVRYQSQGGNTKEVAFAIAKAAGCEAESIDKPVDEPLDILFVGGGVYYGGIDPALKTFVEHLDPRLVKSVAVFSTTAAMNRTDMIAAAAESRNIPVHEKKLNMRFGFRNHAWFGGHGKISLTDRQIRAINDFVAKVLAGA